MQAKKMPLAGASGGNKKSYPYYTTAPRKNQDRIGAFKQEMNCYDILKKHGIHAGRGNIPCPLGHPDRNPSFSIFNNGNKWKCFSCGKHGDALDLYCELSGSSVSRALDAIIPRREPVQDLKQTFQDFIGEYDGAGIHELLYDLWEMSTWRPDRPIHEDPTAEAIRLLECLFRPGEYIHAGGLFDARNPQHTRPREAWIELFRQAKKIHFPLFGLNPVRAEGTEIQDGEGKQGRSWRNAANVADARYALIESDKHSLRDQAAFFLRMIKKGLPVKSITFSGKKSLHGIISATPDQIDGLRKILAPLGFDPQTLDPARMSRLPGHRRGETGEFQSLIYLNERS